MADEGKVFGHPLIRQSSVLALSKFMCVSGGFCERHLDLLFTVMEREKDDAVRDGDDDTMGGLARRRDGAGWAIGGWYRNAIAGRRSIAQTVKRELSAYCTLRKWFSVIGVD